MACRDTPESELNESVLKRLAFDESVIERLVEKVVDQETPAHIAAREEKTADYPGDKMVR